MEFNRIEFPLNIAITASHFLHSNSTVSMVFTVKEKEVNIFLCIQDIHKILRKRNGTRIWDLGLELLLINEYTRKTYPTPHRW